MRCRCLEGLFDTWGAFGRGFTNDLERGGPKPYGARKANLSTAVLPFAQEIALQEQVIRRCSCPLMSCVCNYVEAFPRSLGSP